MRISGEVAADWKIDAQGNKIPPEPKVVTNPDGTTTTVDYLDAALSQIKSTSPQAIEALRRQYGYAAQNLTDKELVQFAISKIPMSSSAVQVKSKDEITKESQTVESNVIDLKYKEQEKKAELAYRRAMTNASYRKNIDYGNPIDLASNGIEKDAQGNISVNYGKNVLLPSAQVYNAKIKKFETRPFVVVQRKIMANGDQQLVGFVPPAGMSKIEAMQASFAPKDLITTPLNGTNYTSLKSVFVSKQFNKEFANRNALAESIASGNIPGTTTTSTGGATQNAYSGYSDQELLSDPGRKLGNYGKMSDAQYLSFLRSQP
jgi:hypothetical protein